MSEEKIRGDEKGMLSNAGREPGDKELWVIRDKKKKKNFKENRVFSFNDAKKFSWSTEKVTHGRGGGESPHGFYQIP